ncbi:MAG: hypothetical protein KH828_02330 [Clostridiales bacterium]|nr:hypothetical protein [Clostridiales bacterium]
MKKSIAGISLFLLLALSLNAIKNVHAWFTDSDRVENYLTTGKNDVEIEEEFPDPGITPGKTLKKRVEFTNTGTVPCFVRAKYYFSSSEAEEKTVLEFGKEGWKGEGDGYFYYGESILPGEKTKPFLTAVRIKNEESLPENFDLILYTETVQSENHQTAQEAFAGLKR